MTAPGPLVRSLESVPPFRRSPPVEEPLAAEVRGELPAWLKGSLLRTCPAVFEESGWHAEHWFDGLGMIYAFEIGGSEAVRFHSRLLDCQTARDAAEGKTRRGTFGTTMVRSFWQRLLEPVPRITDNTNVNIVKLGDDLVAMTEGDRQIIVDPRTLSPRGTVRYRDELGSVVMTAHPHLDFARQRVVNVATKIGPSVVLSVYEHAPNARERQVVASFRSKRVPYTHSFGLTPQHAVLVVHPLTASPVDMLWSNRGYIDHFSWRPSEGTRLVVLDRATGRSREHLCEPFFVFHTVNAFERGDETVLDVLAYENAEIIERLRVEQLATGLPDLRSSLLRLRMKAGTERAQVETLSDQRFEFPATSYRRANGQDYRFAWGAANGPGAGGAYGSAIVKVDVIDGATSSFADPSIYFGEPVFVARPDAASEDDGVLISVGSYSDSDRSRLVVLDARTMDCVASADVPRAIPLGFHGSFVRELSAPSFTSQGVFSA